MHPIEETLGQISPFLHRIFTNLEKDNIDASNFQLDHVCYRVETQETYLTLKKMLSKYGSILSQEEVGGRLISTFKLKQPIIYKTREIDCIELPSPKEGSFYEQGYEHAEFVIDEKFSQFINRHPTVNFSTRAISKKQILTLA